jgi:DNA-binding beta-propeller fold protein YncE
VDETSLRVQLDRALSSEPPLGNLVGNSLRAGRKLRRRRRAGAVALSAAAVAVVVSVASTLTSSAGDKVTKAERAPVAAPPASVLTAYVAAGTDTVVPITLATNTVGTPIKLPVEPIGGLVTTSAAATRNGRTVYEVGQATGAGQDATVTPIDTATNTTGPTITLHNVNPLDIAIDPNGKTAYVSGDGGVFPITIATNAASNPISIPYRCWAMAFTPDGQTLYVLNPLGGADRDFTPTVTPIRTTTNTKLAPIRLPLSEKTSGYLFDIVITPNGKTAYVVDGVQDGKPYANSVIPIDLATNTALAPIPIEASGLASGLVMTPDGRTAYVLSSRAVTPIDTATNQAKPAIPLPASAGYAYSIAMTPNGKTIYVLTPRGVIPIRTASRTVLPMIGVPGLLNFTNLAITPDGSTVYVGAATGVVPISTATNTVGSLINLGGRPSAITFAG